MSDTNQKKRITECHVTLMCNENYAVDRVTSTFALRDPAQMGYCEKLILGYVTSRKTFTVSYS